MVCMYLSTWTHAHIYSWKLGPCLVLLSKVCQWLLLPNERSSLVNGLKIVPLAEYWTSCAIPYLWSQIVDSKFILNWPAMQPLLSSHSTKKLLVQLLPTWRLHLPGIFLRHRRKKLNTSPYYQLSCQINNAQNVLNLKLCFECIVCSQSELFLLHCR
jgi:hypothetical protein